MPNATNQRIVPHVLVYTELSRSGRAAEQYKFEFCWATRAGFLFCYCYCQFTLKQLQGQCRLHTNEARADPVAMAISEFL